MKKADMPIQINELIIRAEINEAEKEETDTGFAGQANEEVQVQLDELLKIIKNKNER